MAKFTLGQSGNSAGRPRGSGDRRTALRELLQPHAGGLIRKAVEMALAGDVQALRICLDRIIPALKPQAEPVSIVTTGNDVTTLAAEVFRAATAGELALDEAATLTSMLLNRARIAEVDEANRHVAFAARQIQVLQNDMTTVESERINDAVNAHIKLQQQRR